MSQLSIGTGLKLDMAKGVSGGILPWYLTGSVSTADVVAAWQAKAAADYAASLVNLDNPGTDDLTELVGTVPWTSATGWAIDGTNHLLTGITLLLAETFTHLIRFRRPVHTGAITPIYGEAIASTSLSAINDDTFSWWHDASLCSWNPGVSLKDPTKDWTLARHTQVLWGNGVEVDDAGSSVALGGVQDFEVGGILGVPTYVDIYAVAMYNRVLTDPELVALTTQIQAL